MKNKKSIKNKKKFSFKIWLVFVISLVVFSAYSIISLYSTGTGPLAFLGSPLGINRIVEKDEATGTTYTQTPGQERRGTATARRTDKKTGKTTVQTNVPITKPIVAPPDKSNTPAECTAACSGGQATAACQACLAGNPSSQTPPQEPVVGDKACPGGKTVIRAGDTVATGHGWKDGKRCSDTNCPQRECIKIEADCSHGKTVACDEAYAKDPAHTVLPIDAGYQYTSGDASKNVRAPNTCPSELGPVPTGTKNSKGKYCFNGSWTSEDAVTGKNNTPGLGAAFCGEGMEWDTNNSKCITKSSSPAQAPIDLKKAEGDQSLNECKELGKGKGGCGENEVCYNVSSSSSPDNRRYECRPVNQVVSQPHSDSCVGNVLSKWNKTTLTFDKTYCSTGCNSTTKTCNTSAPISKNVQSQGKAGTICDSSMSVVKDGKYLDTPSCRQACEQNSEGSFKVKFVDGKVACDVPPPEPTQAVVKQDFTVPKPTKETPNAGKKCDVVNRCSEICDKNTNGEWRSKPSSEGIVCDYPPEVEVKKESQPISSNEKPKGSNATHNANGKLYNGVSCGGNDSSCASGYCGESKWWAFGSSFCEDKPSPNNKPKDSTSNKNPNGKLYNGVSCGGNDSSCASGYCGESKWWAFGSSFCEDKPQ